MSPFELSSANGMLAESGCQVNGKPGMAGYSQELMDGAVKVHCGCSSRCK